MEKLSSRTKTLHYKRALLVGAPSGSSTLAKYLDAALSKIKRPMDRAEQRGDDNVRVINKCHTLGTLICGRFLDYTNGGFQAVLDLDPEAEELSIKHLPPGKREQFLEGVLTFGIRGTHVVMMQAKGLRAGHLEEHLNWLLGQETAVLPPGTYIALEDEPSREVREKLSEVKWVELRASVPASTFLTRTEVIPKSLVGDVLRHLRELRPTRGTVFERMDADAALAVDDVELSIRITRKSRKKDAPSLIDELAHSLRHTDDAELTVRTPTAVYSSGELKLTAPCTVQTEGGGIPMLASAAEVMQEWLADLIQQRRIDDVR